MAGLSDFDLAAFVEASCARHGVPVKITDVAVHRNVALLLSGRAGRSTAQRDADRRTGSDPPNEINTVGIERSTTHLGGSNDDVIEHRADNGVLSGEVEFGPLSA